MPAKIRMFFAMAILTGCLALINSPGAEARSFALPAPDRPQVDLVIALDVSGSMSGLIDSARQRLWDIVNELGQARPTPDLRVSIVSFGNPDYGQQNGYVRIDQAFTRDLDRVNETLFAFTTNGGDEYVARAIDTSLRKLEWSSQPQALRVMFVAGNESASQDPQIALEQISRQAREMGVVVNAIYCGGPDDPVAGDWQKFAQFGGGMYASIDQHAAAVASFETPMDARLATLNQELNKTYIAYGDKGRRAMENQQIQDRNAAEMSAPAAASRTVTKASSLYHSADWDLVDALKAGATLDDINEQDLPANMRAMSPAERQAHVRETSVARGKLQREIAELARQRREYIAEKRRDQTAGAQQGLDAVIQQGLRKLATARGFRFEEGE